MSVMDSVVIDDFSSRFPNGLKYNPGVCPHQPSKRCNCLIRDQGGIHGLYWARDHTHHRIWVPLGMWHMVELDEHRNKLRRELQKKRARVEPEEEEQEDVLL